MWKWQDMWRKTEIVKIVKSFVFFFLSNLVWGICLICLNGVTALDKRLEVYIQCITAHLTIAWSFNFTKIALWILWSRSRPLQIYMHFLSNWGRYKFGLWTVAVDETHDVQFHLYRNWPVSYCLLVSLISSLNSN